MGEEWIVFSSTALALDRTSVQYQIGAFCQPETCELRIEKIRYTYGEGRDQEKYVAEEWITDEYALNKSRTKLVRGLAKWRRNTVDFVDALCVEAADALSAASIEQILASADAEEDNEKTDEESEKAVVNAGRTVITPKREVSHVTPQENKKQTQAVVATPVEPTQPAIASTDGYRETDPAQLSSDIIQIGSGKLVVVIGTDAFNMTMMTANAGGSLGKMSGKPVIYTFLTPDQNHDQIDRAEIYTVRFYPNGQQEPSVILECKKLPSQEPLEGQPRMYIGEILKAWIK